MPIAIVGLGPGDLRFLTLEAMDALRTARPLFLRTAWHPIVGQLPDDVDWQPLDHLYEAHETFDEVYDAIAATVLAAAADGAPVGYAVPGNPFVGEASVARILDLARQRGVPVRFVPGLSFADASLAALGQPVDNLQLVDAIAIPTLVPTVPALVYQVYDRLIASEVKLALQRLYPDDHEVRLVRAAGVAGREEVARLPLADLDRRDDFDHLTAVYVPPLHPEADVATMEGLRYLVARLRGPNGCPWDRQQTHASLVPFAIEEAYEVADAVDRGDMVALADELGDLLLQVVLHAQLADEEGHFDLTDVLRHISTKLVRRHPHVFGDVRVSGADEVLANWEAIKQAERGEDGEASPASVLDDVPKALPALLAAQEIQKRVARVGFDWPDRAGVVAKVREELGELLRARSQETRAQELGDVLFALANLGLHLKVDAEEALRRANHRFAERFRQLEAVCRQRGVKPQDLSLDELDAIWQEVKARARA
ncbi:MAG TPA: nucleoside triphosphate pyrophosphohydrolase [Chloroflexota bacterium]